MGAVRGGQFHGICISIRTDHGQRFAEIGIGGIGQIAAFAVGTGAAQPQQGSAADFNGNSAALQ